MPATLRINLLGGFRLFCDDTLVMSLNTPRLQSLVTYLVLHRDSPQPRQQLAFLLWPDSTEAQARTNLRHLIHQLRQTLPCAADFLCVTGSTLQWQLAAPVSLDVAEFERACEARDFDRAVMIYQGELLPDCYDDWIMPERERLQQMFVNAVEQVVRRREEQRDYVGAIAAAQRLLRCEPLREETYCDLMRLYALSGDRTGVARAYTMCAAVLRQELNVEPGPATQAAYTHYFEQPITSERSTNSDRTPRANHRLSNLPCQLTRFIGREREKRDVKQRVLSQRLLTLVGAGGVGKTRLALAVAEDLINHFADGLWLVDLAPLNDPTLVVQTLAAVLSVREEGGGPLLVRLTEFMRDKHLLVVLDNCEHLTEAVRSVMATLLQAAPHLRVLVTSRVVLGIEGEVTWRVPSFSVPDMTGWPVPAKSGAADASQHRDLILNLRQYESVQFFVERASAVLPTFEVNDQTALAVGRICQQLDGIPLALELAAARVKLFTVHQIADRLGDALRLLTQGSPAALPRHQTLQATLDWSHALLTSAEQALFRRLSVFASGATFEAVEGVCCGDGIEVEQGLDVLSGLVDKSLVSVEPSGEATRFRLHEVARQYARARLVEAGEETSARDRHLDYFCHLAQALEPKLHGAGAIVLIQQLAAEYSNLQAALEWSAHSASRAQTGLRLAAALARFWERYNFQAEGRVWLEKLLALVSVEAAPEVRAAALRGAGKAAYYQNDFAIARACFEQSLTLDRASNNQPGIAEALARLGLLAVTPEEWATARSLLEESLALYRALQDQDGTALTLSMLGYMLHCHGDCVSARSMLEESLALLRETGDSVEIARAKLTLGHIARVEGDYAQARGQFIESLNIARYIGTQWGIFLLLNAVGYLAAAERQFERAARLLGAADHLGESIGASLFQTDRADHETSVAAARAALGERAFAAAWAQGRAMTMDEAIAYALEQTE